MQLPVKILPRMGQQIGFILGMSFTLATSCMLGLSILHGQFLAGHHPGRIGWFLIGAACILFLFSLAGLTVGVINLFGGSPFEHLVIDRQGITRQTVFGARRFSWKDLGPFHSYRTSMFRPRGSELKWWIIADTHGAIEGGATGLWPLSGPASLRIPAMTYLWQGFLVGSLALVTEEAAGWLEQLRQLARFDHFEAEDIPEPPDAFRTPIALDFAAAETRDTGDSGAPESTPHDFGRRRKPVIER
jgi:hypothetical protein